MYVALQVHINYSPAHLWDVFVNLRHISSLTFQRGMAGRLWQLTGDESDVSVLTGFVDKWSPSGYGGRKEALDRVREGASLCAVKHILLQFGGRRRAG